MKAVTVEPGVAGSVRYEEVPEPDEQHRVDPRRGGQRSASAEPTSRSPRARTAGRPQAATD